MQLPQSVGVPKVLPKYVCMYVCISRDAAAKSCCRPSESDLWSTAKTTGPIARPKPEPQALLLRFCAADAGATATINLLRCR